jgi:hypothetical protein
MVPQAMTEGQTNLNPTCQVCIMHKDTDSKQQKHHQGGPYPLGQCELYVVAAVHTPEQYLLRGMTKLETAGTTTSLAAQCTP